MIFQSIFKKSVVFTLFFLSISLYATQDLKTIDQYSKTQKERLHKRGKKIHESVCSKIEIGSYKSYEEIKKDIKKSSFCGKLKEKDLESVSFYLWSLNRSINNSEITTKIDIPRNAKCPICGMFVYKYPKWAAMIQVENHIHYFDGVKDMMKFYYYANAYGYKHKNEKITKMLVSDYYSLSHIDATKAWYVLGSNVYGPMGHELIAFKSKNDAEVFIKNHYGKRLLEFKEIDEKVLMGIDK